MICTVPIIAGLIALPATSQHAGHQASPSSASSQEKATPDSHAGHAMPIPAEKSRPSTNVPTAQGRSQDQLPAGQDHTSHQNMSMNPGKAEDLPVGQQPAPMPIPLGAADTIFGAPAMGAARGVLASEHGGAFLWKLMADQAEYRAGPEGGGYGWDAEAWFGGDIHRLVVKSEGQGSGRGGLEEGEVQALYSRAVAAYTDIQFGVRQDVNSNAATYAVFGAETILPYWLKAEAALFISNDGDAFARLEGTYDLMITQRVVLQPNVELNFAMQDVPTAMIGSGLSELTAGLRLRYDVARQFSPYIGVNFDRKLGGTIGMYRAAGEEIEATSFVVGIRAFL
jgi:copper resistance protein B